MSDQDTERDPIEALATEFVERIRGGEHPTVEEYTTKHPGLAEEIKRPIPDDRSHGTPQVPPRTLVGSRSLSGRAAPRFAGGLSTTS